MAMSSFSGSAGGEGILGEKGLIGSRGGEGSLGGACVGDLLASRRRDAPARRSRSARRVWRIERSRSRTDLAFSWRIVRLAGKRYVNARLEKGRYGG